MKTFIAIIIMITPTMAFSSEMCSTSTTSKTVEEKREIKTDVPKHLEGATIIIRTADGKESTIPAEKFKVVPRKQQFVVSKVVQSDVTTCNTPPAPEKQIAPAVKKNRVSLMGGNGPQEGLDRSSDGSKVIVESKVGAIGGVQYQRLLNERINVGAQLQTNKSILLNIGLDF